MLKRIVLVFALFAMPLPVFAQDASHIARVQAGENCPGCNLFQADLAYHDLPGIDVTGSRLRQADLLLATMDEARFTGANLSVANLFGGRFSGASFTDTNLEDARLVGAYFGGADFTGASLRGANLSGADLATARGLTQGQLDTACGDEGTLLPRGLRIPACRSSRRP